MPEKEASLIEPPTSGIAYGKPKRCSFSANPSRYQAAPSICALLTSILLFSCQNSADVLNRVQINANTSSSTSSTPLTDAKAPEEAGAPVIPIVIDPEAPSCIVAEELSNTGALYLPSLSSTGEVVVKDNITGVLGSVFGTHISVVKGPYGSEQALRFDATNDDSYVSFPYNSNLNQFTGSVDFYFYPERCGDSPEWDTLVSRDAQGTDSSGHFQIRWSDVCATTGLVTTTNEACNQSTGRGVCQITTRLQSTQNWLLATAPEKLTVGKWYHIAVNFGNPAMEIWIDGALVSRIEDNRGLNGNQNALILGASNSGASIARFLKGGRLARIRSDKSRINFGARCIPYETWLDQQNSKF